MSRRGINSVQRAQAIAHHMMSTSANSSEQVRQPPVTFESLLSTRVYKLNRPKKLNALDTSMLEMLRPKIEEWRDSSLCGVVWGSGEGRAFCAGGDVAGVVADASKPETRSKAVEFFKKEFEVDFMLGALNKPYIAIMDGITMGGGVGLSVLASFRVATENTKFAMPETKIGYCPDVGASFFMSRLDGELGTYLALTGETISGRAVFEHGIATHYIPAKRIPMLLENVSALENPKFVQINKVIEDNVSEPETPGTLTSDLVGAKRIAIDYAFAHNKVEDIYTALAELKSDSDASISEWASKTIDTLDMRSPTSLKVALKAVRTGKSMSLLEALEMEYRIAAAYCNGASTDFKTGVNAVLGPEKKEGRPDWNPATVEEVTDKILDRFFNPKSEYIQNVPQFTVPDNMKSAPIRPSRFALPTEIEIKDMVIGQHQASGDTGLTLEELVSNLENLYDHKIGVREKVMDVAARKCKVVDNADGNQVWLKWNFQS
ncbi:3-hydroxyisobutyryl-coenzyme A hydrolase isoform 1 [Dendrothele bispora CBS 962.96]|uniref:3-hydroxyisobutyryl-CoA hydrolase n=1 Tax=Dendrothele bispora (strain CBS 962.96) TaxID=1314807 RepID=A0A4S8MWS0_DENBC|nr:3-hydroxyisobutyryl-coenzyme A hydrolase isoform 1 [Dendrothele bispora CBS 962.96]